MGGGWPTFGSVGTLVSSRGFLVRCCYYSQSCTYLTSIKKDSRSLGWEWLGCMTLWIHSCRCCLSTLTHTRLPNIKLPLSDHTYIHNALNIDLESAKTGILSSSPASPLALSRSTTILPNPQGRDGGSGPRCALKHADGQTHIRFRTPGRR